MIEVEFYTKKKDGSIHMRMSGHADTAPKGKDLVCAGATTLAYTVAQCIEFQWQEGELKCKPKLIIKPGEANIIATPKNDAYATTLHTFFVAQAGISVLSGNYPDAIRFIPFSLA